MVDILIPFSKFKKDIYSVKIEQNTIPIPGLFGLTHSNRDFNQKESWGKNCFNSSFPAALCAYSYQRNLDNIYLKLDSNLQVIHSKIDTSSLYGIEPTSDNLFVIAQLGEVDKNGKTDKVTV